METITKSTRKSLLAAVAVAMLALVAVAGVVTYDADSGDAADSKYAYFNGSIDVDSSMSATNLFIATQNASGNSVITVPADVTYKGTVTFGYHKVVAGVNYDVPFTTLTFTEGITDVTITYTAETSTVTVASNSAASAAVTMTVTGGSVTFNGVTGTVTAAGQSVTLKDVTGLTVAAYGEKAILLGTVSAGTVTVNGSFYAGSIAVTDKAVMTIAKDATVTAVAEPNNTFGFTFTVPAEATAMLSVGTLSEKVNNVYTVTGLTFNSVSQLTVTYKSISVSVNSTTTSVAEKIVYDVVVADGKYYMFPTAAVTDASAGVSTYDATAKTYSFSLNTNDLNFDQKTGNLPGVTAASGNYTAAVGAYTSATANGTTTYTPIAGSSVCEKGIVTFTATETQIFGSGTVAVGATATFVAAVQYGTGDNAQIYLYTIKATKTADGATYTMAQFDKTVSTVTAGAKATVTVDTPKAATISLSGTATLNIEGTFDASATKYTVTGETTAKYMPVSFMTTPAAGGTAETTLVAGTINITGKAIFQETSWTLMPMTVADAKVTVNTVAYAVDTMTPNTTTGMLTCYAGSFATALAESVAMTDNVKITVFGEVDVTADATVPAVTAGKTGSNTLTFELGQGSHPGCLNVGTADTAVVLTFAANGTAVRAIGGLDSTGCIDVVNGSFKVAALDADKEYYTYVPASAAGATTAVIEHGVNAAVFMTETVDEVTYGVFTDLASALIAAKASAASEALILRTDANVVKDCELSVEDTLDLKGKNVFVGDITLKSTSTPTLTLSGVVSDTAAASNGIVIFTGATVNANIDTDATFTGFALIGGTLNYAADVTFANAKAAAVFGTLNVNGTVTADVSFFRTGLADEVLAAKVVPKTFTLNVTVPGEMTLLGSTGSGAIGAIGESSVSTILNLDVAGTVNLSGDFYNACTMNFTLGTAGKVLMTANAELVNNGAMTLDLKGTIVYDKDKYNLTITSGGVAAGIGVATVTESFVMNVTGAVALEYLITTAGTVTVSGTGVLSTAAASEILSLTVSGSAKVLLAAGSEIDTAKVTGNATLGKYVSATTAGIGVVDADEYVSVTTLTVGTASQKLADNVNGATVSGVYLTGTAIVYGTAANVAFANAAELASTVMYMAGSDNVLYATQYDATAAAKLTLPALNDVEGYSFNGWFSARVGGNTVSNNENIGNFASIYAQFTIKTYTLTLSYVEGAVYLVNGNQLASGTYQYDYNTTLIISVIAANGYNADKATVSVDAGTAQASVPVTMTKDTTVTAAGLTAVSEDNGGLSLTDILLIVLVIITAIVAVAVVLKLARS